MLIRFLIMNAYATGGTVRTTLNLAAGLAGRHEVEVVSVYRHHDDPDIRPDPSVRLRALVDDSPSARRSVNPLLRPVSRAVQKARSSQPSRLIHPMDARYDNFDRRTDSALHRYLTTLDGGALISTRVGLSLAMAEHAPPSVLRVAQEHLHLGRYRGQLRNSIASTFPRLDAVSALTDRDARGYRKLLGSSTRVVHIPNAVPDTGPGQAALTGNLAIAIGRLAPQKALHRLVSAWEQVAARHPDWVLRIFGDGRRRAELQAQIDAAGLTGKVVLAGFTTSIHDELRRSSLLAMSSKFEGFPMTLLEAMSCGVPVVSFDCNNGPRDLITHGETGLLIPNGDIDGLAAGVCELIEDPAKRRRLADAARLSMTAYNLPAVVGRWESLLAELAAQRRVS